MGAISSKISLPMKRTLISFVDADMFTPTGEGQTLSPLIDQTNSYETITLALFKAVGNQRKETIAARDMFRNLDMAQLLQRFPQWTPEHIHDLKAQFQTFDLNQDALIDFHEMCDVLDELGDQASQAERQAYFDNLDEDGSGAVDFQEFLALIEAMTSGRQLTDPAVGKTFKMGTQKTQKLRRLSVIQQLDSGVF